MAATKEKIVIVGAGPVGSLAALYAASRGDDVEVYELRAGMCDALLAGDIAFHASVVRAAVT